MIDLLGRFVVLFAGTLILFGALTVGVTLLTRYVGEERLRRWVGGSTITAPLKGVAFGVVTPFCSWSMIPVLLGLVRSRVRTSAIAAFVLASPVLDPVLVVAIAWLFGIWVAVWFTVFLAVATVLAAVAADRLHLERFVLASVSSPVVVGAGARCEPDGAASMSWSGVAAETPHALRFAMDQTRRLLVPLLVTCAVGAAIAGTAPRELLATVAGPSSPVAIPAAALVGVPLYLPTEALAPLALGLRESGVGTGAIFAFLITAASLSLPEFFLLARIFRLRLILGLAAVVVLIAVVGALLVPVVA